jgi:predicted transcriptional regulator
MIFENQESLSFNTQIAIVLRGVRTALAWTQQDLATRAKVSKPTIARIERMEMSPRGDTIHALLSAFRQEGVEIDMLADEVIVRFTKPALLHAQGNLST